MRDDDDKDDVNDDESDDACYRTATTSRTSSIACVDVCVEFPITTTKTSKSKKKENSNRACRSQPYNGEEIDSKLRACERACLDAHATSVALKFPLLDDDTREDYGVVAKNECAKRCATSFPKAEEEEEEHHQHH